MKFKAYGDNILVKKVINKNVSNGGIQLPQTYNPVCGVVIDSCDEKLKEGTRVYYNKSLETQISDDVVSINKSYIHCYEE